VAPLHNVVCVETTTEESDLTNNCDDEDTDIPTPAAATSTPNGMPVSGGGSLDGGSAGWQLLLALGVALTVIGGAAAIAGRRPRGSR
jgi:hypothetical protein